MKKAILQIFTAILVLGLFCGAATAAPSIIEIHRTEFDCHRDSGCNIKHLPFL